MINTCSFKDYRHCIFSAFLLHFLNDGFKIRKTFDGIVQYLWFAEWLAFLQIRLIVAAAFGDIYRDDWSSHGTLLSCIDPR